jgi:5'-3' exonuclease
MSYRILLDTSSLMFRAFFSIPPSVRAPNGRPVNAVHGYLDMTAYLVGERRPDQVVHNFDDNWRPDARVAVYEGYKAQRPPDPEGLPEQFDVLREIVEAAGMDQAELPDWEAEDAIGVQAARTRRPSRVDIVTGDRDLIQLVRDPVIRVLFTVRGVSELRVLDEAGVMEKYGVPAGRYAEFAILRGDPSDGLPGVRGVGEKTARELVLAYPNLDALIADAMAEKRTGRVLQRSPRLRQSIRDAVPYLEAMRKVVPIVTEGDLRTRPGTRDDAKLEDLAERWRVTGPVRRLQAALDSGAEV